MGAHMKTTIDLNDALFDAVKAVAGRRGETFRSIVEAALREYLKSSAATKRQPLHLRRHAFQGRGLRPEVAEGSWEAIREITYGGRGG
jgi:Arc/MetJ family transcription regulator